MKNLLACVRFVPFTFHCGKARERQSHFSYLSNGSQQKNSQNKENFISSNYSGRLYPQLTVLSQTIVIRYYLIHFTQVSLEI